MARESPPTRRVTALLDAVISRPAQSQSLAELARRTAISKATCLGILNELCAAGYLARDDAAGGYRPGPRMLAAGAAAEAGFASIDLVRPALLALAGELDRPVTVSAVQDGHGVIVARMGPRPNLAPSLRPGLRSPLRAGGGLVFYAWDDDAATDSLTRGNAEAAAVVASAHERGYLVEQLDDVRVAVYDYLAELGVGDVPERLAALLNASRDPSAVGHFVTGDIAPDAAYDVSYVAAPARGRDTEYLVSVLYMERGVSGAEVLRGADALLHTCADVTTTLSTLDQGRAPGWR